MKNLIITLLLLANFTNAQTGSITYKVVNTSSKKSDFKTKMVAELELMSFKLANNKDISFFTILKYIPKDKLISKAAEVIIGASSNYFQYNKTKSTIKNVERKSKVYQVNHNYKMNNWKLTNESTVINGYTCFKAINTKYDIKNEINVDYIAWHTPQIAAPYGPIGFGGLPGTTIKLSQQCI